MSGDQRNNFHTSTGWQPVTPPRGSKGWNRVVARGCGGHWSPDTPNGPGEFNCGHGYAWACEDCPVGITSSEASQAQWECEHQGPPRPESMRPEGWRHGLWDVRAVATELAMPTEPCTLEAF